MINRPRILIGRFKNAAAQVAYLPKTLHLVWTAARAWTAIWLILLIIQGLLPVATVYLTRSLVDQLVPMIGRGWSWQTVEPILLPAGLMGTVLLLTGLLQGLLEWIRMAQAELVRDYMSGLIHKKSISIDYAFYESSEYFDRLNRARADASGRSLALLESSGSLFQNSITLFSMAALLLPYGIWLPILLFLSTLPAFYVVLKVNRRNHQWWEKTTSDRRCLEYYELLMTHSAAAAEIRLFGLGEYFQLAYQAVRRQLRIDQMHLAQQQAFGRLIAGMTALLITGVAAFWILRQAVSGTMSLGDLALFYQAFNRGQSLMRMVLGNLGQIYNNSLFLSNLFEFLQLQPQLLDPSISINVPIRLQQGIQLQNITFCYPDSNRPVLKNFNLTLPAGKIVAIVGDNGAGKSTLVKLLCRFYDPEEGSIQLDGTDIRNFSLVELRRLITVLFQSPIPYCVTAAQNIALGDLTAPFDMAEIQAAARNAGVHGAIERLANGYETLMGKLFPGGGELSGGEWQRLALARAFFRQAPIIILDEPTSAMDPWAEADWLKRFRELAQGRTAIVITHRFTLAMQADIIHVMRAGQIVESGNHQQLLNKRGLYAQSWQNQMQSESPAGTTPAVETHFI